jgi:phosphohistidine phosphatase
MDVYLVRHAVAFDPDYKKWPTDRDRPLTPEGIKRFRRAAKGLVSLVSSVDVMLSSPYRRAWQTAELLAAAGWPAPVESEALVGHAPTDVLQAVAAFGGVSSMALVGHEPTMHELVSYLLTADTAHAQVEFGKGAVARLEIDDLVRPGSARLKWMLAPKVLRALSG